MSEFASGPSGRVVRGALALLAVALSAQVAHAGECSELSARRNAIYKAAGYCFKTAAQIRIFGNAGCQFDDMADVPLSANDRAEVASIVGEERALGCR